MAVAAVRNSNTQSSWGGSREGAGRPKSRKPGRPKAQPLTAPAVAATESMSDQRYLQHKAAHGEALDLIWERMPKLHKPSFTTFMRLHVAEGCTLHRESCG